MRWVLFFLIVFIAVGCAARETTTIQLEGAVSYEGYGAGQVLIAVYEDVTYYPQPLGQRLAMTPGEKKAEIVLDTPGSFQIVVEIGSIGSSVPNVLVLAYLYRGDFSLENNIAGAFLSLPAEDHEGIEMNLVEGLFPVLL